MDDLIFPALKHWLMGSGKSLSFAFLIGFFSASITLIARKFVSRNRESSGKQDFILMSWPILGMQIFFCYISRHSGAWIGPAIGWYPLFFIVAGIGLIDDLWAISGKYKLPMMALMWVYLCYTFLHDYSGTWYSAPIKM